MKITTILTNPKSTLTNGLLRVFLLGAMMAVSTGLQASGGGDVIQSKADPFGLDIVGKVQAGGSDEASAVFQKVELPKLYDYVNQTLGERAKLNDSSLILDPSKLKLANDSEVRVYFIGEGAGYRNSLGFTTGPDGIKSDDAQLIFPDASSSVSYLGGSVSNGKRTADAPLLPGDFVDLGKFSRGTLLDFFLIANGANGGKTTFYADPARNPDKINHVISFAYAVTGSPLLILGFEDLLGGGDRDFNDVVFAVDIGVANIQALTAAPEPAMILTAAGMLGMFAYRVRRKRLSNPALS